MKKKRLIFGGIIIAVLAAAIAAVSFIKPTEDTANSGSGTVTDNSHDIILRLENADEIILETEDENIHFVNRDGEWGIDGIDKSDLNSAKVKAFVSSALLYTSNKILNGSEVEYGLEKPTAMLKIKSGGEEHTIKLGDVLADGSSGFASADGTCFTMQMTQRERLLQKKRYYTEVSRVLIKSDEIEQVAIETDERRLEVYVSVSERLEGNVWYMSSPYEVMANDTYMDETVLPSISTITLSNVTDNFDGKRASLAVKTDKEEYVFEIGGVNDGYCKVKYNGKVYEERADLFGFIEADTFEYMNKLVSYRHIDDVKSVLIEYGDIQHSLDIKEGAFEADGTPAKADASKVFYTYLIGVVANGMYGGEDLGDTLLRVTFKLMDGGSDVTEYKRINEYTAAVVKNGETIFTTGIYDVEELISKTEVFYD